MSKTNVLKHIAAFVYDVFPVIGILIVTSGITLILRTGDEVQAHTWWFQVFIFCEIALYYIYFWKVGGQTIGMKAWKIHIKPNNENQQHLSWKQASTRFLVGIFSTALLGLGLFWKFFSKEDKSWMDLSSDSHTTYNSTK
jgi:uncharacterized RDD family membrane protein YckC